MNKIQKKETKENEKGHKKKEKTNTWKYRKLLSGISLNIWFMRLKSSITITTLLTNLTQSITLNICFTSEKDKMKRKIFIYI